jgi:hypothetical protein
LAERLAEPPRTLRWTSGRREFLVCVRASASPAALAWFDPTRPRSWDLFLSYYEAPAALCQQAEFVSIGGCSKYLSVWQTNEAHEQFLLRYRATLLLDDDVEICFDDVEKLFSLCTDFKLALAQPSLSERSYVSWPVTLNHPSFRLRFTNFVEVMAPLFSRDALVTCLPTFRESVSGWGLDMVWPVLLGNPRDRIAIVDEVVVTHTRPVDVQNGRFYNYLRNNGISPYDELAQLCDKYGIARDQQPVVYGAYIRVRT